MYMKTTAPAAATTSAGGNGPVTEHVAANSLQEKEVSIPPAPKNHAINNTMGGGASVRADVAGAQQDMFVSFGFLGKHLCLSGREWFRLVCWNACKLFAPAALALLIVCTSSPCCVMLIPRCRPCIPWR